MSDKESPFIEGENQPEAGAETQTEKVDIDALMGKLEQFDVKDPAKLEGKLRNAGDFAQMQSERDHFANEVAQLRADVQSMSNQPKPAAPAPGDDFMETQTPVDIESVMEKSIEKVLSKREQKAAQQQQHLNNMWLKISGHKKYHLVKDDFEAKLRDPSFVMQIQTGQVDPFEAYTDMVMDKYEGVTKETVKAFKQMKEGAPGVSPPHVESGARAPGMTKDERTARDKKLDELREKAKKNPLGLVHDDDQDSFIDSALGDMLTK